MTETQTQPKFSAEFWAAFWAAPDAARAGDVLADDIVGYWQGDPTPVRGKEPYVGKIAELVGAVPDLKLELIDSATVDGDAARRAAGVPALRRARAPGRTDRSPSAVSIGSAPATASWWRTSSVTTWPTRRRSERIAQPGARNACSAAE